MGSFKICTADWVLYGWLLARGTYGGRGQAHARRWWENL